jgi:uracil-DNA glycosylase
MLRLVTAWQVKKSRGLILCHVYGRVLCLPTVAPSLSSAAVLMQVQCQRDDSLYPAEVGALLNCTGEQFGMINLRQIFVQGRRSHQVLLYLDRINRYDNAQFELIWQTL